jgi:hypothetical protein
MSQLPSVVGKMMEPLNVEDLFLSSLKLRKSQKLWLTKSTISSVSLRLLIDNGTTSITNRRKNLPTTYPSIQAIFLLITKLYHWMQLTLQQAKLSITCIISMVIAWQRQCTATGMKWRWDPCLFWEVLSQVLVNMDNTHWEWTQKLGMTSDTP